MKKRFLATCSLVLLTAVTALLLASCTKDDTSWKTNDFYDTSLPNVAGITDGTANEEGWFLSLQDNFDGTALNESAQVWNEDGTGRDVAANPVWTTSPHAIRWKSDNDKKPEQANWWCPSMVEVKDGLVHVYSKQETNHVCPDGICPASGRFTSGIETRKIVSESGDDNKGGSDELLFSQAFGYFETRVKFPNVTGLWSAFWLQSSNQRKLASEGVDGTEIDVFESAFIKNKTKMGNALLWNGYSAPFAKVAGNITDTKIDLYDGFHTFALKWTPEYYVFYIDGIPSWASVGGGVAKVKEFLRFTVEIDAGDGFGPHGQKIGKFKDSTSDFQVDYVKVYQNKNWLKYVIADSAFPGKLDERN